MRDGWFVRILLSSFRGEGQRRRGVRCVRLRRRVGGEKKMLRILGRGRDGRGENGGGEGWGRRL